MKVIDVSEFKMTAEVWVNDNVFALFSTWKSRIGLD